MITITFATHLGAHTDRQLFTLGNYVMSRAEPAATVPITVAQSVVAAVAAIFVPLRKVAAGAAALVDSHSVAVGSSALYRCKITSLKSLKETYRGQKRKKEIKGGRTAANNGKGMKH